MFELSEEKKTVSSPLNSAVHRIQQQKRASALTAIVRKPVLRIWKSFCACRDWKEACFPHLGEYTCRHVACMFSYENRTIPLLLNSAVHVIQNLCIIKLICSSSSRRSWDYIRLRQCAFERYGRVHLSPRFSRTPVKPRMPSRAGASTFSSVHAMVAVGMKSSPGTISSTKPKPDKSRPPNM